MVHSALENGADSYEKLFSSDRLLTEIQFHGGILYLKAPRNYVGDNSIYYAVNIDAAVYTEIEVDGSVYRFGKDVIVKIDQTGAYFTNRFLEPIENAPVRNTSGRCTEITITTSVRKHCIAPRREPRERRKSLRKI